MTSPASKLIIIIGATGAQGGSVLDTFLENPAYRIRAITRNATSAKAQALASRSSQIEIFAADLSDPSSLARAFQDATSIFAVTDWSAIIEDPVVQAAQLPPGKSTNEYACELETLQARNVFDVAATTPTLERLVFSTLANVSKLSGGKYAHAYHFDSKALAVDYLQSTHPDLWKKTSLVQVGAYLENFVNMPLFKPQEDSRTGSVVFETLGNVGGNKMLWPFVAAREDTGPVVQALIDQIPAQKHVLVHRGLISYEDLAQIFENVTGKEASVQYGKKLVGLPEALKLQFEDTFGFAGEFGYWGRDQDVLKPTDLGVDLKLGSVEEWIGKQDWNVILSH